MLRVVFDLQGPGPQSCITLVARGGANPYRPGNVKLLGAKGLCELLTSLVFTGFGIQRKAQ